jgi:hypothetical protein
VHGYGYVDSAYKFVNVHSPHTSVAFLSCYKECERMNNIPGMGIKFLFSPVHLLSDAFDLTIFGRIDHWFVDHYPLSREFKDVFGNARYNWILGNSRIVAARGDLSWEEKVLTHLVFSGVILHDDISEQLMRIPDDLSAVTSLIHNCRRCFAQQESIVRPIDLNEHPSFPKELLPAARLLQQFYTDIGRRMLSIRGKQGLDWILSTWDHFQNGVMGEPQLCRDANEQSLGRYTENRILALRSRSIGATLANAPGNTLSCIQHLTTEDPFLRASEMTLTCEADMSTCYKEWAENEREGRVVNVNTADYHRQVLGLTIDETVATLIRKRNERLKVQLDFLNQMDPSHERPYWVSLRSTLIFNDYSYRSGIDSDNNRYGWCLVPMDPSEYQLVLPYLRKIGRA